MGGRRAFCRGGFIAASPVEASSNRFSRVNLSQRKRFFPVIDKRGGAYRAWRRLIVAAVWRWPARVCESKEEDALEIFEIAICNLRSCRSGNGHGAEMCPWNNQGSQSPRKQSHGTIRCFSPCWISRQPQWKS